MEPRPDGNFTKDVSFRDNLNLGQYSYIMNPKDVIIQIETLHDAILPFLLLSNDGNVYWGVEWECFQGNKWKLRMEIKPPSLQTTSTEHVIH